MPNWSDPADVRRWIAEREEEENQDKVRNWRGGQGIGPKTREEYEADLAAARQDAGRAASWRAPIQQVADVRDTMQQTGGRSAELLRQLYERAGYEPGDQGRGVQEETTGRGMTRSGQASTSDRLRDVEERPTVSASDRVRDTGDPTIRQWRPSSPNYEYDLVTSAEQMQPGDTLPAHMRYRMGIESGQLPQPQSYSPPRSYMQAMDEQRMAQQAAALPEEQRGAGYDVGNAVTGALGPAWTYYESRRDQRAAENQARIDEGTQSWYDPIFQVAGNALDLGFLVPQKALTSADTNPLMDFMAAGTQLANGQPITQPDADRPRGMTPAQVYAPIGGAFNKLFNPFNPNNIAAQGIPEENRSGLGQWQYMLSQAGDYIWTEWQRNNAMNVALEGLPEEQRREAELSLLNATSGSQKAWDTWAAIQQKQNAGTLLETAKQLAAQGDTQTASQMYQTYRELEATSYADVVDQNQNIWAELVEGIFADPTSIVLDPIMDAGMTARRMGKATAKARKAATASTQMLDQAVADGIKLAGNLEQGIAVPTAKNWIQQLFSRTGETRSHMEADALWKTATQLFRGVDNAADAKLLLQTWIENPAQLIQGVTGVTSKALRDVAGVADGKVRYGYLTVAGDEQLQALPILQSIKDDLLNLPALNAQGRFNALEFLTQMDTAVYNGVRKKYGLESLEDLGEGAVRWNVRRLEEPGANGERWAIDYLNADGGVVRTSDAMSLDAAKKYTAGLEKALKAGTGSKVMGGLKMVGNVQRGFLSDMWLNLRPSHWIRNAAAATAATMADDLYTLRSVSGILDEMGAKFVGAAPTLRLQETLSGAGKMVGQATQSATEEGQHWSRAIWEKNNPYAAVNEAASQVWSGMTHLFGTDIPFGEQAFYLRAFDKGFNRAFGKVWGDLVTTELAPKIQQLGIDPNMGRAIIDRMISAGVTGSKQDVAQAARKAVYGAFQPFDPRTLGVPDELLSADGWKAIQNGIEEWLASTPTPDAQLNDITRFVLNTVAEEKVRYGNILRNAPPQPGVYEWSKLDGLDEAAEVMDNLTEAAKRAGMDPAQAAEQAKQLAGRLVDGQQQALDEVLQEVATANNPAALNVAFDLLTQLHALKTGARRQVDELSRLAADASTPEMWAQKWQKTGEIYTQLSTDLENTIRGAADDIRTVVAGGDVGRKYDWWATVRRYFDYDEAKVMEARSTPLGGSKTPRELWDAAIDANRQYVDASMVQLYDAFRRFPSVDALDVLRQAQKQIDTEGARIAAWLAEKRDLALAGTMKWEDYFDARNMAWYKGFDNMVVYNEAAKRAIVAQGLADEVPTQLRWTDDFAGGEFFLIGPSDKKDGYWLARRLDDGTIHRFDTPGRDPKAASPLVPQEVLNDWYTVTDQTSRMKPVLAEIEAANPLPPRPEVPSGTLTPESVPASAERADDIPFYEAKPGYTRGELRQATDIASDVDFGAPTTPMEQIFPKRGDVVYDTATGKRITIEKQETTRAGKDGRYQKTDRYQGIDEDGNKAWYDGANLRRNPPEEPPAAAAATPEPAGPQPQAPTPATAEAAPAEADQLLTKPAGWSSPQRSEFLEPGEQVTIKKTGETVTVTERAQKGGWYWVEKADGTRSRYKAQSLERMEQAAPAPQPPTAATPEEGMAQAAGLDKPPAAWVTPEDQAKVDRLAAQGKKSLTEEHGATLQEWGYSPQQIKRMSPEEMAHAITQTSSAPTPAYVETWQGYKGGLDMKAADEERRRMRDAWHTDVANKWTVDGAEFPELDKLIKKYADEGLIGLVNRDRRKDPRAVERLFENLYGSTIGGERIENLGDVERFIQRYMDLAGQYTGGKEMIGDARQFKGKGVTEIIAETYDELLADGWKPYEIKEMAARSRAYVLDQVAAARGLQPQWGDEFKGMATYESRIPRPSWMGEGDGWLTDNPKETLENLYDLIRSNWGKRKQPEVGDVAVHMIQTLDDAADRIIAALPQLAQRTPNTLDAGQKRFILQAIDGLLPQFDNAVSTARQTGEALANGAMLNYQDRRGFDSLLSLVFPYHYFWTRGGMTWAKRLMTQPKTLNLVYEADRAINNENQQTDLPMRLGGSIPALANVMGGQVRAGNILNWLLPKPINDFVDPEAANNDLERWIMRFQQVTPGFMPAMQFALNSYFDQVAPLPGGQKRVQESVRKYIPMYGAASDVAQALTGQQLPYGGDPYDPYRTRRALSMMAQEGQIDGPAAQYAQQISMNVEQGLDRYAGIPQQAQQAADAAYQAAMQRAGAERALTSVTGLVAGTPLYYYPDAETELRQAQRDYGAAGYNPNTNPYGSAEQRRDVLEQNPGLPVYWSRNATPGKLTPAQSAQRSEMWEKLDAQVYGPMADAVTKAIIQNPAITEKEINQIKSVFYDRGEAIKAQYPDVPESERNVPSGANPTERAVYELETLLRVPGKPTWPGESATPAQMQQYYAAKAAWDEKRLNTIDQRLNQFVAQAEADPTAEWQQELVRLVQGRYSSDLLRQYQEMKYATDTERAWGEMEALRQEQSAANWKSKGAAVGERMGPEAQALWNEYHATPKENRQALKEGNPAVREVIMAGYNPNEYDQAVTLFGPDAWQTYYSPDRPQYPEGGDEATMQAYYDQLRQWNTANPRDAEMRMWLNGRATWGEKLSSHDGYYDFGDDWQEAKQIFGEDIFEIERASNTAPDFIAWRNANPEANMRLTGYKEWKKAAGMLPGGADWLEPIDLAVTPGAQPTPATMMPSANGMPRPLGSERRPVGAGDWQAGLGEVPPVPEPSTIVDTSAVPLTPGVTAIGTPATPAGVQPSTMVDTLPGMQTTGGAMPGSPYEWAMRNPSYAKYQASAAQWETRKQNVYSTFGQETGSLYEQYLGLPANSAERKAFKLEHPELRAVQLYTWQPEAYAQAEQLFGADGIMAWAKTPAYQDTPEAKAARSAYIDANPKAFTVGAWLYGRPGQDDEDTADDEQFRYNLGADYATAKEMFGANIWAVVEGYKRGWDKQTKSAYYNSNPNLSPFFDWWYGNMPKTSTASTYTRSGSSYGGGYGGGGGGWSGGGGGGGGTWSPNKYPPRVDGRWMDRDLEVGTQAIRRWRPDNNGIDLSWMRAGDRLKPDQLKAWRPKNG